MTEPTTPPVHPAALKRARDAVAVYVEELRQLAGASPVADAVVDLYDTTSPEALDLLLASAIVGVATMPSEVPAPVEVPAQLDRSLEPDGIAACPRCGVYRGADTIRDVDVDDDPRLACLECVPAPATEHERELAELEAAGTVESAEHDAAREEASS